MNNHTILSHISGITNINDVKTIIKNYNGNIPSNLLGNLCYNSYIYKKKKEDIFYMFKDDITPNDRKFNAYEEIYNNCKTNNKAYNKELINFIIDNSTDKNVKPLTHYDTIDPENYKSYIANEKKEEILKKMCRFARPNDLDIIKYYITTTQPRIKYSYKDCSGIANKDFQTFLRNYI